MAPTVLCLTALVGTVKTEEAATQLTDVLSAQQIDVLEVEGKFYGFSGCHRYEVRWLLQQLACKICAGDAVHDSRAALQCCTPARRHTSAWASLRSNAASRRPTSKPCGCT